MELLLHTYFRSSASYRVRIALNLKGLEARHIPVHLTREGGEQHRDVYKSLNPSGLVPLLSDSNVRLSQSLAILEYLEEAYPATALLPRGSIDRAYVRQLALDIACEIHPLNNLRVLKYLTSTLGVSESAKTDWIHHWISLGFQALEGALVKEAKHGMYCYGDEPTIADCCLVPQMFNARRFGIDLEPYPTLLSIDAAGQAHPAFAAAHPSVQSDAE